VPCADCQSGILFDWVVAQPRLYAAGRVVHDDERVLGCEVAS
jgi:hypothetical protein